MIGEGMKRRGRGQCGEEEAETVSKYKLFVIKKKFLNIGLPKNLSPEVAGR